jgi:hypothetical protein
MRTLPTAAVYSGSFYNHAATVLGRPTFAFLDAGASETRSYCMFLCESAVRIFWFIQLPLITSHIRRHIYQTLLRLAALYR